MTKPPIGLVPYEIWRAKTWANRYEEITTAIDRYKEAGLDYPVKWEWEREEILERFSEGTIGMSSEQS